MIAISEAIREGQRSECKAPGGRNGFRPRLSALGSLSSALLILDLPGSLSDFENQKGPGRLVPALNSTHLAGTSGLR